MSTSFGKGLLEVMPTAHLETAIVHEGYPRNCENLDFTFRWEMWVTSKEGEWINFCQGLSITKEQARVLHEVIGHMLSTDMTATDFKSVVSNGELKEEYTKESVG